MGYCMGGPMRSAPRPLCRIASAPCASFHGGGLVTDAAEQPAPAGAKTKAQFLIAIAENDDKRAPNEKNVLKETFAKANCRPKSRSTPAPRTAGARRIQRVYNEPQAEKAWAACSRCTAKLWPERRQVHARTDDGFPRGGAHRRRGASRRRRDDREAGHVWRPGTHVQSAAASRVRSSQRVSGSARVHRRSSAAEDGGVDHQQRLEACVRPARLYHRQPWHA